MTKFDLKTVHRIPYFLGDTEGGVPFVKADVNVKRKL